ncbi:MAG: glucose 1-dehydrogenase [Gemmatimonadaceae bacterium]
MRVLTVQPAAADSARLEQVPEPVADPGTVLIQALALGICGTDHEIVGGQYGWAPPGRDRLVLGHESLGCVADAPTGSGFGAGDLVVGIVRLPDPEPCASCAVGEWDMCRNGLYTEHGIKERDGFAAEWFRLPPERVVRMDSALGIAGVLLEPTSIVAKAWEHTERIGRRARWEPRRVLVTGAGPIGLLSALLGVQRGLEVHVFDRVTEGPKPDLVRVLGATYHTGSLEDLEFDVDVVLECTGAPAVVAEVIGRTRRNGIVCLTGVSSGGRRTPVDLGLLNRTMVLENDVVFGSVNANRRHYEAAGAALAAADRSWLERLITRRVPLKRWADALERRPDDVKVVIDFTQ